MTKPTGGRIFKIAHYAIHDGPGIRTTVFLKGCPARCLWCCSPESQKTTKEIAWNRALCRSCGRCMDACAKSAAGGDVPGFFGADGMNCSYCGECVKACPTGAVEICGRDVTAEQLLDEIYKDEPFWRRSGGGVTLSGGEVLAQPLFAKEFLECCRSRYTHTAIETCLFAPLAVVKDISESTDYIQFDIKAISGDLHKKLTSLDNEGILKNASYLLQNFEHLLVRYPLVPGCNDSPGEIRLFGEFLSAERPGAAVEILPYHRLGLTRYEAINREYELIDTQPPSKEEVADAADVLKEFPLEVIF